MEHRTSVKRFVSLQFLNLRQSAGLLGRVISPSQGRYLDTNKNKRTQASVPWVRFEPTIPAFERAKTFHALDSAAIVIGHQTLILLYKKVRLDEQQKFISVRREVWPPLWSNGQSCWLQIQRSRVRFRRYQIFLEVVGLERGPLSLMRIIEKLLERTVAAPV
jgi:hypothetical protein